MDNFFRYHVKYTVHNITHTDNQNIKKARNYAVFSRNHGILVKKQDTGVEYISSSHKLPIYTGFTRSVDNSVDNSG